MNLVFVSPDFPKNYYLFCQELKNLGVNVLGIVQGYNQSTELLNSLTEMYRVNNLSNYDEVYRAVAYFASKYGKIDYVESNNEYWLEQDSWIRTDFNICTGKKSYEINCFKSKEAMKECYHKANVKVARYIIPDTFENGKRFVEEVGYPVIVKPDNGVGAYATYKINNEDELKKFYFNNFPDIKYIMEEFIKGDLISFDGIVDSNSNPVFSSNEVFPTPIMDIVNQRSDTFYYCNQGMPEDLYDAGCRVLKAFDAKSRYFHLEFFRLTEAKDGLGDVGDIIGLEVNMRPPGGYTPDMINFAHSVSTYRIWAEVIRFNKTYEDFNREKFYSGYYGRRDGKYYIHSHMDIVSKYRHQLVMCERMPDVLSGAMGNMMYVVKVKTFEELQEFRDFCSK